MIVPNKQQIDAIADELAQNARGGANVYYSEVLFHVDLRFPGMSDSEFDSIRAECLNSTSRVREAGIRQIWSN